MISYSYSFGLHFSPNNTLLWHFLIENNCRYLYGSFVFKRKTHNNHTINQEKQQKNNYYTIKIFEKKRITCEMMKTPRKKHTHNNSLENTTQKYTYSKRIIIHRRSNSLWTNSNSVTSNDIIFFVYNFFFWNNFLINVYISQNCVFSMTQNRFCFFSNFYKIVKI